MFKCKICNREYNTLDPVGFHLSHVHNMSLKEYYDRFLKKPGEDVCITCGGITKFAGLKNGYKKFCCSACASRNKDWLESRKANAIKKYGCASYSQTAEYKEKVRNTCLEKYGVENPLQAEQIKEKIKQTNLEKYGVENPLQCEKIKNKVKNTNLEKYGREWILSGPRTDDFLEKQTKTSITKYGTKLPCQSEIVKNKIKNTTFKHYGVNYSLQSKEIQEKTKENNLKKYGVENAAQRADVKMKMKQTSLERYGVENPSKSKIVKEKYKQTCLEKYGVESANQCPEIAKKQHKKFYKDGKMYDSSYEYIYEQYLIKNDISYIYQPKPIQYVYKNKVKNYFPDFEIIENGQRVIVELKGSHFFEDEDPNKRMINPWDRTKDDLAEAKHQCMIANNVRIITDITPYIIADKTALGR